MHSLSHRSHLASLLVVIVVTACNTDTIATSSDVSAGTKAPAYSAGAASAQEVAALNAVLAGNAEAITVAPSVVPPGAPLTPFVEARLFAIANVAMHDALNAIEPHYDRYADTGPI